MEIVPFIGNKRWRKRGYNRLSPTSRRNIKIVRLNGGSKRSWRVRLAPKLRLMRLASPLKLWYRFKNAYVKMMLKFANLTGTAHGGADVFGSNSKRISKARGAHAPMADSRTEFENRLILEIYKSMTASLELGYKPTTTSN